jgi:tetratricopeptide (TPR) repeat protein
MFLLLNAFSANAQELKDKMRDVYSSYKALQKYLYAPEKFEDPKNNEVIKNELFKLTNSFHKVDEIKTTYKNIPGYEATLKLVHEMLDDSYNSFTKGNKAYAQWELRGLGTHCATCHFTYNKDLRFDDSVVDIKGLSNYERGNFYYSTRQFDKASKAFLESLHDTKNNYAEISALRRWLVVQTRANVSDKNSYDELEKAFPSLNLPIYEKEEVRKWLDSLESWKNSPRELKTLEDAERIIRNAISVDPLIESADSVSLLKATALIHSLLPSIDDSEKAQALLDLGISYDKLPLFFIDELPEMYLQLAIEASPGSKEAKSAFHVYSNIIDRNYSGSGGTNIPSDVRVKLIELYNKAFAIPNLSTNKIK